MMSRTETYMARNGNGEPLFKGRTKQELLDNLQMLPSEMELFDVFRSPRMLSNPDEFLKQTTLLTESGLLEDLSCPICMGTYQTVMVVKDCLHRFCSECIQKWIRSGKQVCPKCRKRIPSRRSLRADPIFERMVRRLFPNVQAFEAQNDDLVARANRRRSCGVDADDHSHSPNERSLHDMRRYSQKQKPPSAPVLPPRYIAAGSEANIEQNPEAPVKRRRGRPPGSGALQKARAAALAAALQASEQPKNEDEIMVFCISDPNEPLLKAVPTRKSLRVRPDKTVGMIISWMRGKFAIGDSINLQLAVEGDHEPLPIELTMADLSLRRQISGPITLFLSLPNQVVHGVETAGYMDFTYCEAGAAPARGAPQLIYHPGYSAEESRHYTSELMDCNDHMSRLGNDAQSLSKRCRFGDNLETPDDIVSPSSGQRVFRIPSNTEQTENHGGIPQWSHVAGQIWSEAGSKNQMYC